MSWFDKVMAWAEKAGEWFIDLNLEWGLYVAAFCLGIVFTTVGLIIWDNHLEKKEKEAEKNAGN